MTFNRSAAAFLSVAVAALAGCVEHVSKDEFDTTIAQLRDDQARTRGDLDTTRLSLNNTRSNLQTTQTSLTDLRSELSGKFQQYDTQVSELEGKVRIDMSAHFDTNQADLRDQDKVALDDFAGVMRKHHPKALVTVEGFTDASGSAAYNKQLGLRRAKNVRDYLVAAGGLDPKQLRVLAPSKAPKHSTALEDSADPGQFDRRVALVVDDVGTASANKTASLMSGATKAAP